ncbi:MAG: hypothetical protein ABJN36_12435 [Cyclobacteriaceae bacterium]
MEGRRKARREPKEAVVLLDSLLKMKPDFCHALAPLGWSLYTIKNFNEAKRTYKKILICDPVIPISYLQLSRIYREYNEFDSAEFILLKWLNYEDEFPLGDVKTFYTNLGEITRAKNQHHKSIEYLTEAIARCTDDEDYKYCGDLFYLRADSYAIIDETEKAWEDVLTHEQLKPEDGKTLVLKGEILQKMEKFSESTAILEEYLENPTNLGENWVHFMIGYNYNRLKEFEKSCFHLNEAVRLGYEHELLDVMLKGCSN